MKVTVKVAARFVDPAGADVPAETKSTFMKAFREKVPLTWNNKLRFTLNKKGFEGVSVRPEFAVVESAVADAHYDLKIVNNRQGRICVRTTEDQGLAQVP